MLGKEVKKFTSTEVHMWKIPFLGRAVDSILLRPIRSAAPTENTMNQALQVLDYISTQEEAVLAYNVSDMKLVVDSMLM